MEYITSFFIGFLAAFIGLLAPSMLNMTSARTSIENGKLAGLQFAGGAASLVLVQGGIAVFFAKYLVKNPMIILKLKTIAVFVLLGLAIFFFIQARKKFKAKGKQRKGTFFITGITLSSLNMLAVPFYLAMATLAERKGWMKIEPPFSFIYVIGAAFGAFSLFTVYVLFASYIAKKAQFIAQNINYILSVLFITLATITFFQIYTKQ